MSYDEGVRSSEPLNERLKRLLAKEGMTETDAASLLGTSQAQVNRLLNGTTSSLKLAGGLRLARRLKVSPWYLAGLTDDPAGTMPDEEEQASIARVKRLEDEVRGMRDLLERTLKALGTQGPRERAE